MRRIYWIIEGGGDNIPYSIFLRKKKIIVQVSGNSLADVRRFARYALSVLPAT